GELLVEPVLLAGERIAVLLEMRPEGPAEAPRGQGPQPVVTPTELEIGPRARVGEERGDHVVGIPGQTCDAANVLAHHVHLDPVESASPGLGELPEVVAADGEDL